MNISGKPSMLAVHIPPGGMAFGPEGEFAPHTLTGYTDIPYNVTKSSDYFDQGHAWRAFNGTFSGANVSWLGVGGGVDWIQIDVGSAYLLTQYSIAVNSVPEPNRAPKNWTMLGSDDGITWNTLDTVTNQTGWGSGETRTFVCDVVTNPYPIFRLNITANNGDGTYTQVGELYLIGKLYLPTEKVLINAGHPLAANLAAVVPLYEGSGLTATDVLNTRTSAASVAGSIVWINTLARNTAVIFKTNNGDFSNFGLIANYNVQTFSAEALIYLSQTGGPYSVFGTGPSGVQLRIYSGKLNLLKATVADMGSSATTLATGQWHHVGVTYDGATVRFYLNGVADGTAPSVQTFASTNFGVGSSGAGAEKFGDGNRIAYVYMWKSRVLTVTDFASLVTDPYSFLT